MKVLKIGAAVVLVIMAVAIWACCKMSGECDRKEEKKKS